MKEGTAIGYSFDWNNAAEQSIAGILGLAPDVGSLLSALVYIFWPPSGEDIWKEIEAQVEQLINQKLSDLVQAEVAASLQGLNNNMSSYLIALKDGSSDPTYISEKWNVANGDFLQQLPTFQLSGYQLLLLPLFAQFANLHLSLLRDGVLGGAKWGWTPPILNQTQKDLTKAISDYSAYATKIYQNQLTSLEQSVGPDNCTAQPFRTINNFVRSMTLAVLDFANMWPYFDPSQHKGPVKVVLDREIYTDPPGDRLRQWPYQTSHPADAAHQPNLRLGVGPHRCRSVDLSRGRRPGRSDPDRPDGRPERRQQWPAAWGSLQRGQ